MCVDYRALNEKTILDLYPMPSSQEMFDNLHRAKYFTLNEAEIFLGLAGYYWRFQQNYAKIAALMYQAMKDAVQKRKDKEGGRKKEDKKKKRKRTKAEGQLPLKWKTPLQQVFETLKENLIKAPILRYPDMKKPFIVLTDASRGALEAVLGQQEDDEKDHVVV